MTATAGNISAVSGLRLCQLPFTPTDKTGKAQQHPHIYAKESILPERNGYPSVLAGFLFPLRPFISQCDATPHPKPRCPRLPDTISAPSLCQMSHGPASATLAPPYPSLPLLSAGPVHPFSPPDRLSTRSVVSIQPVNPFLLHRLSVTANNGMKKQKY